MQALELREPAGAFPRLEEWLRQRGFCAAGCEECAADVDQVNFATAEGCVHSWVGGGVVRDSDPAAEVEESWTKARPLLETIGSRQTSATGVRR